jgi:chromosome segregation ATPase
MSTSDRPLLGEYVDPESDKQARRIAQLEEQIENLRASFREECNRVQALQQGMKNLRHQLAPLHNALRLVFGELDAVGVQADQENRVPGRVASVWESWKQKLGGKQAEFIQALLDHGEMSAVQLKVATHTGTSTVPQVIYKLNQLGLINKNGGKYSLKQL